MSSPYGNGPDKINRAVLTVLAVLAVAAILLATAIGWL